jgi:hypothetical protein
VKRAFATVVAPGLGASAIAGGLLFVGIIANACIRTGSLATIGLASAVAAPWAVGFSALCACGFSVQAVVLLSKVRGKLIGTGVTLDKYMTLSQDEKRALIEGGEAGDGRDA